MPEPAASTLVPRPSSGRVFGGTRTVRFGDVNRQGRARLDALATYTQDLAGDDTIDLGHAGELVWIVRRAVFEVHRSPRFLERLRLETWCSGLGRRWAERRVSMVGEGFADAPPSPPSPSRSTPASVEGAVLWVAVDRASGRPEALPPDYVARVADAAGGRTVSARLQHDARPPAAGAASVVAWAERETDFDLLQHVNNAAAWAMVEQVMGSVERGQAFRAEIEFRAPVELDARLELRVRRHGPVSFDLWAVGLGDASSGAAGAGGEVVHTTARVCPLE